MKDREIICPKFFGDGEPLYKDQLGWDQDSRLEAKSSVSKKIFNYFVVETGMNMVFYNADDGHFYGIHTELIPTPVFRFKEDPNESIPIWKTSCNTHDYEDGELIGSFLESEDIWDNLKIQGKSLEEILQRSYIVNIN